MSALFLLVIATFFFFDIVDDWYEGISLYHVAFEVVLGSFGFLFALFLFFQYARERTGIIKKTRAELIEAKQVATKWQEQAKSFRAGLSEAITKQLERWEMTDAEKEICFLLLKGFSLQEIADLRNSSERTVRQQASIIYKKSGLTGRIQLAAFFLEDLLAPG